MTRYRSYDWENEIDPVMSIECLNPTGLKKRLTPEEILERIDHMAWMPVRATKLFYAMQNQVKQNVGVNVFEPVRMGGALSKQIYLPAVFEFEDDEALVLETDLPKTRRYWNFQLNDPYFNAMRVRLSPIEHEWSFRQDQPGRQVPRRDLTSGSGRAELARSRRLQTGHDLWPLV